MDLDCFSAAGLSRPTDALWGLNPATDWDKWESNRRVRKILLDSFCCVLRVVILLVDEYFAVETPCTRNRYVSEHTEVHILVHNARNAMQGPDTSTGKGAPNHDAAASVFNCVLQTVLAVQFAFSSADVLSAFIVAEVLVSALVGPKYELQFATV